MKRTIAIGFLLAAVLARFGAPGAMADEFEDYRTCLHRVNEEVLEAKIEFQNGLADLILDEDPGLGALAALNRDLQIALAKARHIRLDYVIETDLARLVSASELVRFMNFDWSLGDEAALQAENADYAALVDRINVMTGDNNSHPAWPELRARFVELQKTKDFQDILKDLNETQERAGKRLEEC